MRILRTVTCSLLATVCLATSAAAQLTTQASPAPLQEGRLYLNTGPVDTATLPHLAIDGAAAFEPDRAYVVQLDQTMTPAMRTRLAGLGVVLGDYLPKNAFIATLDGVSPQALGRLPFVSWVGRFDDAWKLDPQIGKRTFATPERQAMAARGEVTLTVTLFREHAAADVVPVMQAIPKVVVHGSGSIGVNEIIHVTLPLADAGKLAAIEAVQYVEEASEVTLRNSSSRWILQSNVSGQTPLHANGLTGLGQIVGIMDGKVDVNHCSLDDPAKVVAYNTTNGADSHGTHVAGTVVGDNGVFDNTRGMAYEGRLVFDDIPPWPYTETNMRNNLDQHHGQGARLHTNSWGDDGTTSYNSLTRAIDSFTYDNEDSLVLFAETNGSALKNPENAKNVLAVAASQDTPNQNNHCTGGVGPTSDSRRKPEVYAPGCSTTSSAAGTACGTTSMTGTSMACPAATGMGMLVRQYFADGYYPSGSANLGGDFMNPSGALVKATLVNSSVDMTGIAGYPSLLEGWGRILADDALFFSGDARQLAVLADVRNAAGLATAAFTDYAINVTGSGEKLKITLVFVDPPASASTGTAFAAINDLDLEVIAPGGGSLYLGNVFSGGVSVTGGTKDDRNNVEQVHIAAPAAGSWTLRVRGAAVNQGLQGYALIATGQLAATAVDCNANGIGDACDIDCGLPGSPCDVPGCGGSADCNGNGVPDECESAADCNGNGLADICDLANQTSPDCNGNGIPDECEVPPLGAGADCNSDGVPDECEPQDDCNGNTFPDFCDIAYGTSLDCNGNGIPDECDSISTATLLSESFEGAFPPAGWTGTGLWHATPSCARANACLPAQSQWAYYGQDGTCDFDTGGTTVGVLTAPAVSIPAAATAATLTYCSAYGGEAGDSNTTGYDWAWLAINGVEADDVSAAGDNPNWSTRTVDLSAYAGQSVQLSWHFDSVDSIANATLGWEVDVVQLTAEVSALIDCNGNGVLDECDVSSGSSPDCNTNGIPDECETGVNCGCVMLGDMDGDSDVDGDDIQGFVTCYISGSPGAAECVCADMASPGTFDAADVASFVDCLMGVACP